MTRNQQIRELVHNSKDFILSKVEDLEVLAEETEWMAERARRTREAREAKANSIGLCLL